MSEKAGRVITGDAKTRCLPRIPVTMPVRFRLDGADEDSSHLGGWALDLSLGGMLLRCDSSAGSIGKETELHVQFPVNKEWISATGKVVWAQTSPSDNSHLLGICFTDFAAEDMNTLQHFMDSPPSE